MSKQGIYQFTLIMSSLLFIAFGYNNCADNSFEFQAASDGPLVQPGGSIEETKGVPAIFINNNADYTNDADVNLSLSSGSSAVTEMFISNDSQCSRGQWEPYQKNKSWMLSEKNKDVAVYVKYRMGGDEETECVHDNIIHDDIPPVVQIRTQTQNGWIASRNFNVAYTAEDSGSGIALTECARDASGVFKPCGQLISFFNLVENQNYVMTVQAMDRAGNSSGPQQLN